MILELAASVALNTSDLVGTWQGKLMVPGVPVRRVLKIEPSADGVVASVASPDETDDILPVNTVAVNGTTLTIKLDVNKDEWHDYKRNYTARLSSDGKTLTGKWSIPGGPAFTMNFVKVNANQAWSLPPHPRTQYVTVAPDVNLEVVDWGGTGKPLVLLAGQGNTAHIFSGLGFARSFTHKYHVYGITRRGYGSSSKPDPTDANYSSARLGADVVAVLDALHIEKPVVLGHSVAGEELSELGTHYRDRISGLVYLDAGDGEAFHSYSTPSSGFALDSQDVRADIAAINADGQSKNAELKKLQSDMARVQRDIAEDLVLSAAVPNPPASYKPTKDDLINWAIDRAEAKYGAMNVPILAIYANPVDTSRYETPTNKAAIARASAILTAETSAQIKAFQAAMPRAKVIVFPHADHYIFESNEVETQKAINAFLASLRY